MLRHAASSHKGRRRRTNEDAYGHATSPEGAQIFCVADGMGGFAAGDVASRRAVDAVRAVWQRSDPGRDLSWRLAQCVSMANDAVLAEARERGHLGRMGSTIVLLAIRGRVAHIAHAGDSRAYQVRGGRLRQLTADHTEAAERVAAGLLDPEQAEDSQFSHVVTRGLGLDDPVVPELTGPITLHDDDTFLLCSDGLTGLVDDPVIHDVLQFHDLDEACRVLIRLANSHGGTDNITVQLVRIGARRGPLQTRPPEYRVEYGPQAMLIGALIIGGALVLGLILVVILLATC